MPFVMRCQRRVHGLGTRKVLHRAVLHDEHQERPSTQVLSEKWARGGVGTQQRAVGASWDVETETETKAQT